jgi:hypothetical protein
MEHQGAATLGIRSDLEPKEPVLPWLVANVFRLAVYLAIASVGSALVYAAGADLKEQLFWATTFFIFSGLAGIPGTILWLMIVANLPPELSTSTRRILAVVASPLIQIILLVAALREYAEAFALFFGVVLPAGSAFVVRLRERRPSPTAPLRGRTGP